MPHIQDRRQFILWTVADVGIAHVVCVLIGAPFIDSAHWTLLFAALMVMGAHVRPSTMEARRQELLATLEDRSRRNGGATGVSEHSDPFRAFLDGVLTFRERVFLALGLIGSLCALLDWREPWIAWPLPSSCLVGLGIVTERWWNRHASRQTAHARLSGRTHL